MIVHRKFVSTTAVSGECGSQAATDAWSACLSEAVLHQWLFSCTAYKFSVLLT